jgi:hypothetical protein
MPDPDLLVKEKRDSIWSGSGEQRKEIEAVPTEVPFFLSYFLWPSDWCGRQAVMAQEMKERRYAYTQFPPNLGQ